MQRTGVSRQVQTKSGVTLLKLTLTILFLLGGGFALWWPRDAGAQSASRGRIGREVSVARHLEDDQEFSVPLAELLTHGRLLFSANWTEQEGGGRPLTKGTGRPLSDPTRPLTGVRAFNRVSAPDANSCAGCHNAPYGITGGGGDFVTNVFVLAQRFDAVTFDSADTLPTRGTVDEAGQPATLHGGRELALHDGHVRRRLPRDARAADDGGAAAHARQSQAGRDEGADGEGRPLRQTDADEAAGSGTRRRSRAYRA